MTEEHVVLSERPEDQLKAVEWAREQKKKILDDKSRRIADALMEKNDTFDFEKWYTEVIYDNKTKTNQTNKFNKPLWHHRHLAEIL